MTKPTKRTDKQLDPHSWFYTVGGRVMKYIFAFPKAIPAGMVLVHNNVILGITPSRRPGVQGFRAWLSPKGTKGLKACPCGWAPKLGQHYRIRFPIEPERAPVGESPARPYEG